MNSILYNKLKSYKMISYHFFIVGVVYCLVMVVLTSTALLIGLEIITSRAFTSLFIVVFLGADSIFYVMFRKFCKKAYDDIVVLLFFDYSKATIYSAFRHNIRLIGIKMTLAIIILQTFEIVMILGFKPLNLMIEGYLFVIVNSLLIYEVFMHWILKPFIFNIDTKEILGL